MNKHCPTCDRMYLEKESFCKFDGTALSNIVDECEENKFIGEKVGGKYLITKFLGKDYQGDLYLAHHTYMGEAVLVKMMTHPDFSKAWQIELMRRDLQLVMRVQHSNAMRIFDFGVTDTNITYIVTEKISGISLSELLKKQTLSLENVLDILEPVCLALAEIHKKNIVHRLLSPDNIFVEFLDGKVDIQKVKLALPVGLVPDNPEYMSPEQAQGLELIPNSNIYSLGVILYQILTGQLPFVDSSSAKLVFKHIYTFACPPQDINPNIPFNISVTILKALAKRPQDRQRSVLQLAQEMRQALEQPVTPKITEIVPISPDKSSNPKDLVLTSEIVNSTEQESYKNVIENTSPKTDSPVAFWKTALGICKRYFTQVNN